ncbi:MAG: hypothetical protein DI568_16575 [Sphingomonas sp.]|nr:MAG: hypothetical protein DI568_16575 [Sphingomonas sp.]
MPAVSDGPLSVNLQPAPKGDAGLSASAATSRPWVMPLLGLIAIAFLMTSLLSLLGAWQLRQEKLRKLDEAAYQLSQSLDREVETQRALLVGLSSSPMLQRNDLKAFHAQMQAVSIPDDTWLVLFNEEWLLAHSRFPFTGRLRPVKDYKPNPLFFKQLHTKRFVVTPRFYGPQLQATAVTVNIAVPRTGDGPSYYLASVMGDARFEHILRSHRVDPGTTLWIADWLKQGLMKVSENSAKAGPSLPAELVAVLHDGFSDTSDSGRIDAVDGGRDVVMSYFRSPYTHWTSVASLDDAEVNAPLQDLALRLGLAAGLLALAGWVAFRLFHREVRSIEGAVDEAHQELLNLSHQLQGTQDEERRRIARELHDSTLQHLTGALLEAKALEKDGTQAASRLGNSIEQAVNELRSYSYGLMPQDADNRPLSQTLADFAATFADRTGLSVETALDPAADDLPQPARHALLRIGQEALANVHRHAGAQRAWLSLETTGGRVTLTVRDDGRDARGRPQSWFEARAGVGLASMRSRASALGGGLSIQGSEEGTQLMAWVPLVPNSP